jgi:hypothetical protein
MGTNLKIVRLSETAILPLVKRDQQGFIIRCPKRAVIYPNKCFLLYLHFNIQFPYGTIGRFSPIPHQVSNRGLNILSTIIFNSTVENQAVLIHNLDKNNPLYLKKNEEIAYLTVEKMYMPEIIDFRG